MIDGFLTRPTFWSIKYTHAGGGCQLTHPHHVLINCTKTYYLVVNGFFILADSLPLPPLGRERVWVGCAQLPNTTRISSGKMVYVPGTCTRPGASVEVPGNAQVPSTLGRILFLGYKKKSSICHINDKYMNFSAGHLTISSKKNKALPFPGSMCQAL
jgi:hypothetical protein